MLPYLFLIISVVCCLLKTKQNNFLPPNTNNKKTLNYLTVFRDLWRNQQWQWLERQFLLLPLIRAKLPWTSGRRLHLAGVLGSEQSTVPTTASLQLQNVQSLFPGSSRRECPWQIQEGVVEHPAAGKGSVTQGQRRVRGNLPAGVGCGRQVEVSRRVEVLERAVQVSAWSHHGLGTSLWACDDLVDFLHSTFLLSVGRWYHEGISKETINKK